MQGYPEAYNETWWVTAVGGVLAILFGLAALFWPGLTVVVLVALFGAYTLIYGIVSLVGAFRQMGAHGTWWPAMLIGLLSIGAGLAVFFWPGITAVALLYVIAIWAIIVGVAEIVGAFVSGQWTLALVGVISILFGIILLANPLAGALAYVMVIGVFAVIRGVLELFNAGRMPASSGTA